MVLFENPLTVRFAATAPKFQRLCLETGHFQTQSTFAKNWFQPSAVKSTVEWILWTCVTPGREMCRDSSLGGYRIGLIGKWYYPASNGQANTCAKECVASKLFKHILLSNTYSNIDWFFYFLSHIGLLLLVSTSYKLNSRSGVHFLCSSLVCRSQVNAFFITIIHCRYSF